MFKLRRQTRFGSRSAQSWEFNWTTTMSPIKDKFLATLKSAARSRTCAADDSNVYTLYSDDDFAAGLDYLKPEIKASAQRGAPRRAAKVIAVIREPDGQSRFFHPELSRRAGRPVWAPLQSTEG